MRFIHEDPDFLNLLAIVAREVGISEALVEKDYWVTHALWALHETGLDIWFKGGTSLSKGFGLIQRFSEDLDLMILPGSFKGLPEVTSWTSENKGSIARRQAYYDALIDALMIPGVRVDRDRTWADKRARGADYRGFYPGAYLKDLASAVSPTIRLEVGRARVVPFVMVGLSSFVHDYLDERGMIGEFKKNRPVGVRCVHPLVTLLEKIDAISRRFGRAPFAPDGFARHYEDAAKIIRSRERLPSLATSALELAEEMVGTKDLRAMPQSDDPAFVLAESGQRAQVDAAYAKIEPMFWGERIPLAEARSEIRRWLAADLQADHAPRSDRASPC